MTSTTSIYDRVVSTTLTVAVVGLACTFVVRELGLLPERTQRSSSSALTGRLVAGWQQRADSALRIGKNSALLTIVVFNDYQCPGCQAFNRTLNELRNSADGLDVASVTLRLPLPYHPFAVGAMRAVDCAGSGAHGEALHELLFAKQDSLGVKPWVSFAHDAGVRDARQFAKCMADTVPSRRMIADQAFAKAVGVRSTPTVVLNGLLLSRAPTLDELRAALAAARAGRPVVKSTAQ